MNRRLNVNREIISIGTPIFLLIGVVVLLKSALFTEHANILSIGVTIDLILTIPLVYFLLIRKTKIPNTTIVPVLFIGVLIGSFLLPNENQYYLSLFKTWALPLIEISIITFVGFKVRGVVKEYRINKETNADFYTALKDTCSQIEMLPKKLVMPFVTEIAVIYYGFIHWKKIDLKENEFTYHKDSGTISLLGAFIFLMIVETFVLHLLLVKWTNTGAWILTGLSIYGAIQFFGFTKSIMKRPMTIEKEQLKLRYGILNETTIDLKTIVSVVVSNKSIEFNNETRKLSPVGEFESHNVVIRLKETNTLVGFYGIKKTFKTIAFYVDKKEEFKSQLENAIQSLDL